MPRRVRLGGFIAVAGLAIPIGTAGVASAAGPGWSIQSPAATRAQTGTLASVSCVSNDACVAVGTYGNDSTQTQRALAESWDGTRWQLQLPPNPVGSPASLLLGVSCTSPTQCMAVGDDTINAIGDAGGLAESWDGTAWTIRPIATPDGASDVILSAVACTSPAACVAVGSYTNSSGTEKTLAELWTGTSWAVQPTPDQAGASSYLVAVSCSSAARCVAVGGSQIGAGTPRTLTEAWDGDTWATETPAPSEVDGQLSGVACPSADACTAVGGNEGDAMAEAWNGATWTAEPLPASVGNLTSISCTAATMCTAGGYYYINGQTSLAVLGSNGTTWAAESAPTPVAHFGPQVHSVSCSGATACMAVGDSQDQAFDQVTLTEEWDGTSWTVRRAADAWGLTGNSLAAVSCPSTTACMAVGAYDVDDDRGMTQSWDGTGWTVRFLGRPTPTAQVQAHAVSCTSSIACTAVGSLDGAQTLVERWDGVRWQVEGKALNGTLSSVSCTSPTVCTAVGEQTAGVHETALALRRTGTAWTPEPIPAPAGAEWTDLAGVSCASPTTCVAFGTYQTSSGVFGMAASWNGADWALDPIATPTDGRSPRFTAASCVTPTDCVAVGFYDSSTNGAVLVLAQKWDGGAWSTLTAPGSAGGAGLSSVSCTSSTACTAVGHDVNQQGVEQTLADVWDGTTWTVQATPNPTGRNPVLSGVSCSAPSMCTAVGTFTKPVTSVFSHPQSLIERHS